MLLRRFAGSSITVESVSFGSSGNSSARDADNGKLAETAFYGRHIFSSPRNGDCFCRGSCVQCRKTASRSALLFRLLCGGGNDGGDTQFQIIGTQFEGCASTCADKGFPSSAEWTSLWRRLSVYCDCFSHVAFADCKFHLMIHARFRKDPDRGVIL